MVRVVVLALICLLALAGCRRADVTDVSVNPEGGVDITAELSESDVNEAIQTALSAGANPLFRNPQVDLQAGKIVITGEHNRRDGNGTASGTATVLLTVENGALKAQVTDVNIEGWEAGDERIAQFNQRLEQNLVTRSNRENRAVTFTSVSILDDKIEIKLNARRR